MAEIFQLVTSHQPLPFELITASSAVNVNQHVIKDHFKLKSGAFSISARYTEINVISASTEVDNLIARKCNSNGLELTLT